MAYRDFFYFRVAVAEPVQHFSDVDVVEDDCPGGKVVQLATLELRLLFQPTDVIARIIYSRAARVARVSVQDLEFIRTHRLGQEEDQDADCRLGEPGHAMFQGRHMIEAGTGRHQIISILLPRVAPG